MSTHDETRIERLVGEHDRDRGGGIPLSSLFCLILETILDADGTASRDDMLPALRDDGFLGTKVKRLQHIYRCDDPWDALLDDALAQLQAARLTESAEDGRWRLGPKFEISRALVVIPGRRGGRATTSVRIYPASERNSGDAAARTLMNVRSLAAELHPDRRGLRALDEKQVASLAESMTTFGYLPDYPVLTDQHGRILDGRHRLAAAERAAVEPVVRTRSVASDREAVAVAYAGNEARGWSARERAWITKQLGGETPARALGIRWLVRNALLDDPARSNRKVAVAVGCDDKTVGKYRAELEAEGAIDPYDPDAEHAAKRAAVRAAIEANPEASDREIGKRQGVDHKTVSAVRGESAEVPHLPHPEPASREDNGFAPRAEPEPEPLPPEPEREVPAREPDPAPAPPAKPPPRQYRIESSRVHDLDYIVPVVAGIITDLDVFAAAVAQWAEIVAERQRRRATTGGGVP